MIKHNKIKQRRKWKQEKERNEIRENMLRIQSIQLLVFVWLHMCVLDLDRNCGYGV